MNIGDIVGMSTVTNTYRNGVWEVVELDGERVNVTKDIGTRKVLWASWHKFYSGRTFEFAVEQVDKIENN